MVNTSLAILPSLQNDAARLITILLLSEQQTLIQFLNIATPEETRHNVIGQITGICDRFYFHTLENKY